MNYDNRIRIIELQTQPNQSNPPTIIYPSQRSKGEYHSMPMGWQVRSSMADFKNNGPLITNWPHWSCRLDWISLAFSGLSLSKTNSYTSRKTDSERDFQVLVPKHPKLWVSRKSAVETNSLYIRLEASSLDSAKRRQNENFSSPSLSASFVFQLGGHNMAFNGYAPLHQLALDRRRRGSASEVGLCELVITLRSHGCWGAKQAALGCHLQENWHHGFQLCATHMAAVHGY